MNRRIRVLSIPGPTSSTQYVPLFCRGLEEAGVQVVALEAKRPWRLRFDVLNIHFPAHYIAEKSLGYSLARAALSLLFYTLARATGRCRIVYTVHDVVPFEPRREWLLWPYLRAVQRMVDGYMFLSDSSREDFYRRFPGERAKPSIRIDHGTFPVRPADPRAIQARRAELLEGHPPCLLVGFLGSIKSYKGIEILPFLPERLADGTPVRVLVAGAAPASYRPTMLAELAKLTDRLIHLDQRLSDAELDELLQIVDVVLMPYTKGWNSGTVVLALGLGSRILARRRPIFQELEAILGRPWIYVFADDPASGYRDLGQQLARIRAEAVTVQDRQRLAEFLAERSFAQGGAVLRDFYLQLLCGERALVAVTG